MTDQRDNAPHHARTHDAAARDDVRGGPADHLADRRLAAADTGLPDVDGLPSDGAREHEATAPRGTSLPGAGRVDAAAATYGADADRQGQAAMGGPVTSVGGAVRSPQDAAADRGTPWPMDDGDDG